MKAARTVSLDSAERSAEARDADGAIGRSAERIYAELRARILAGDLAPGTALDGERALAPALGTNRNTLREAIRMLEQDRLVSVRHGKSVLVNDFRKTGRMELIAALIEHGPDLAERVQALTDVLALRTRVLDMIVGLAAERAGESEIARLDETCKAQLAAFDRGDRVALAIGDRAWIDGLVDAARSLPIRWMANGILDTFGRLAEKLPAIWLLEPTYPVFLRDLFAAIAAHDAPRAREVARAYFENNDHKVRPLLGAVVKGLSAGAAQARKKGKGS